MTDLQDEGPEMSKCRSACGVWSAQRNVCQRGTVPRCSRGYEGTKMYTFLTILARLPPNDSENRKTYQKSELDIKYLSSVVTYVFIPPPQKKIRSYINT
jgi:hypothetical protein